VKAGVCGGGALASGGGGKLNQLQAMLVVNQTRAARMQLEVEVGGGGLGWGCRDWGFEPLRGY